MEAVLVQRDPGRHSDWKQIGLSGVLSDQLFRPATPEKGEGRGGESDTPTLPQNTHTDNKVKDQAVSV